MNSVLGFCAPVLVYVYIFILNAVLPGRWVDGYVTKEGSGEKLKYRLNGLLVLITVVLTWAALCYSGMIPWDWFYQYRWEGLCGAIVFGLIFSFVVVLPHPPVKKFFLADFYLGRALNLQL